MDLVDSTGLWEAGSAAATTESNVAERWAGSNRRRQRARYHVWLAAIMSALGGGGWT